MPQAKSTAIFIFHLIITIGAYFVPFLISWQIAVPVFVAIILQHAIFGRCLLNAKHGLSENDGSTFYSVLLERLGFQPNKEKVRFFVRKLLYSILAIVTLIWQVLLGNQPLWF
ncbi:hypothetical protein [Lacibacter sp. H407]|uniref:hypothetical protein n=1 Tax=Lacibacter sp. H407 TaxID=3133423 RepID=UPI0030C403B7